jgi:tRNA(Ile)-lysidine synthase
MSRLTPSHLETIFAPVAGAKILGLAVSGGPDSLALMLLAAEWAQGAGLPRLVVYSVDHALRPEAAGEVQMVLAEAAALGLAGRGLRWEGDKPETGVQAQARKARYRLLAEAMAEDGAEYLLTAHHLGDQAETVLMRMAHGSGIEGLRGMEPFAVVEGCHIFRPFLGTEADDLEAVVKAAGLTPARDPSNGDRHYERVRWRQLMPALEDVGLDARRLGVFAQRMVEADALIAAEAEAAFDRLAHLGAEGDAEMPHAGIAALPRVVVVRMLQRVLREVGGDRRPHAISAIEALHSRLAQREPLKPATLHGCVIASDGLTVSVRRETARRDAPLLTAN